LCPIVLLGPENMRLVAVVILLLSCLEAQIYCFFHFISGKWTRSFISCFTIHHTVWACIPLCFWTPTTWEKSLEFCCYLVRKLQNSFSISTGFDFPLPLTSHNSRLGSLCFWDSRWNFFDILCLNWSIGTYILCLVRVGTMIMQNWPKTRSWMPEGWIRMSIFSKFWRI